MSKPEIPKGAAGSMALVLVVAAKSLLNARNSVWLSVLKFVKSAAIALVLKVNVLVMTKVMGHKRLMIFMELFLRKD